MTQSPPDTYDWYDEDDAFQPIGGTPEAAWPGLPPSWRNFGWWMGGAAFAVLWILQSWSVTDPSSGKEGVGRLVESFWDLLLAVAICYGIHHFCRPRHPRLGRVLCVVSALVMLLQHAA